MHVSSEMLEVQECSGHGSAAENGVGWNGMQMGGLHPRALGLDSCCGLFQHCLA